MKIIKREIDDSHYYWIDGEFVPGVTSILDEAAPMPYGLKQFFLNNTPESAGEIGDTAKAFGSKMHDAYERLLNGLTLNLKDEYKTTREKKHIVSFAQWFEDFKPTSIQTEQVVGSKEYKYAGTLDCLCTIGDKLCLIDFKTSAGIYWNYEVQVAAYRQAVKETLGLEVDQLWILRTGTKHKCGYEFKEVTKPFSAFQKVYDTYLDLHDGKIPEPPLIDVYPDTLQLQISLNQ